jgi:hypothetical protein
MNEVHSTRDRDHTELNVVFHHRFQASRTAGLSQIIFGFLATDLL